MGNCAPSDEGLSAVDLAKLSSDFDDSRVVMRTTKPGSAPHDSDFRDGFQAGFQAGFRAGIQGGYQTGYRDGFNAAKNGGTETPERPQNSLDGAAEIYKRCHLKKHFHLARSVGTSRDDTHVGEMGKMAKRVAVEATQASLPDPGRPRAVAAKVSPRALAVMAASYPSPRSHALDAPPRSHALASPPRSHALMTPPDFLPLDLAGGFSPPRAREASGTANRLAERKVSSRTPFSATSPDRLSGLELENTPVSPSENALSRKSVETPTRGNSVY